MRYHTYTNNKDIVVVTSTYAGKVVRGVAKCSPNDEFNLEYGEELAKARCDFKVAELRWKRAYSKLQEAMDEAVKAEAYRERMECYLDDADQILFEAGLELGAIETEGKLAR